MANTSPAGLERSCTSDWLQHTPQCDGIQRIAAFFGGHAYSPHRHDTYAIGYTVRGVQSFRYRGEKANSTQGKIMVIHPDELHDGQAGSDGGFLYQMLYIKPELIRAALGPSTKALPFVKEAVFSDPRLLPTLQAACADMSAPLPDLLRDQVLAVIADALWAWDQTAGGRSGTKVDSVAVERARDYLEANSDRTVRSTELEEITQQDRYSLARQFRATLGTSPYRYLTMRRLEKAQAAISRGASLADAAAQAGFSDQAHMTRQFATTYGMSPGRWRALSQAHA